MFAAALSSGSSGNCFYIEEGKNAVLVDVGISAKKVLERLEGLKRDARRIKGIFITHEHSDHICGADVLARRLRVPVFGTKKTLRHGLCSDRTLLRTIRNTEVCNVGAVKVRAFPKSHSADDPVSYTIVGGKNVSVITDIGYLCKDVIKEITAADFLFLESNHDLEMLRHGPYPAFLKAWIQSNKGHLSNQQAAQGILEHASPRLQHVVLSHLSETNNTPHKALGTFRALIKERKDFSPQVSVSVREEATTLFRV